jgi:tetratricopeptide (TPR) repeat protein/predicted aspartyl protease
MPRPSRKLRTCCHGVLLALFATHPSSASADAKCKLGEVAQFPIRIEESRAILTAGINGADAGFTLDSGAFYSMLTTAAVSQYKLETHPAPFGFFVMGTHHGTADVSIAKVQTLTLSGIPLKGIEFLVGGSDPGAGTVGLMGQNLLHLTDVEYDLRQGMVRLMRPIDCGKVILAYWTAGTTLPYSVISLDQGSQGDRYTGGSAYVNGAEIKVRFDTGAPTSVLSTRAAARAGITPASPGVVPAGFSGGVGSVTYPTYIAPFGSFKIGDEEIKNAKLRIADLEMPYADMLLGLDFFLSHHIYVANSQGKLYFTYDGGPVFDLKTRRSSGDDSATTTVSAPPSGAGSEQAADLIREGAAAAARGQIDAALADFNRAIDIAPDNPDYLYQRGAALRRNKQPELARADFDRVIQLAPGNVPARLARSELSLSQSDRTGALADLDAADAAAPKEADIRFTMAELYRHADRLDRSVQQFDLWIGSHGADMKISSALNGRCWVRALQGTELPQALKDCNAARGMVDKTNPLMAQILDSRALVLLRMNDNDKSLADYDLSLKMDPSSAWGWYGRGVVELRLNKSAAGQSDMEHAKTLWPKVADAFTHYGIVP